MQNIAETIISVCIKEYLVNIYYVILFRNLNMEGIPLMYELQHPPNFKFLIMGETTLKQYDRLLLTLEIFYTLLMFSVLYCEVSISIKAPTLMEYT